MTRFVFQGSGHTTGGDWKAPAAIGAVVVVGYLAYEAAKSAAATIGNVTGDALVAAGTLVVAVAVRFVVVRARGRRRTAPPAQPQLWHANPQAIPPQPRREIAAPQVVVNIDAGLLAGFMAAAQQQQAAPVIVQAEHEELPR